MKVVLAGPYPAGTLERFQRLLPGHEVVQVVDQDALDGMLDIHCLILRILKPDAVLRNAPALKAVIRWGAGFDSVDIEEAGRRGVLVANTPGVNAYAVAELAVGMMIALNRKLLGYWENVRGGNWDRSAFSRDAFSLNNKVVGLVGGGNIGRRVAALVQAFGAQTLYYDVFRLPEAVEREKKLTFVRMNALLNHADIISLHVPLLDSTRHIIGKEQLRQMKPGACLINTARGGLLDDAALLEALRRRELAGAGLDCVEDETPEVTAALLKAGNVMITPHIGGTTADMADVMIPEIAGKIRSLAETGDMKDVVNRQFLVSE